MSMPELARYFIELSYVGTHYSGWQVQKNGPSVQGTINGAISTLLSTPIEVTGASRTDAGVHARQNYAHFDFRGKLPVDFTARVNKLLPPDIAALRIRQVKAAAHARFSAVSRSYEYIICLSRDPFKNDRAFYYPYGSLDLQAMNKGMKILKGFDDFSAFCRGGTQVKTMNCKIIRAGWSSENGDLIFRITADRFLRGMVRGITGTLIRAGSGKYSLSRLMQIAESRINKDTDFSPPPHALYLTKVSYPFKKILSAG